MSTLMILLVALMSAGSAAAHGALEHGAAPEWTFDPWIVTPIALAGGLFAIGQAKLAVRSKERTIVIRSGAAYWGGWTVLFVALMSPLHFLGEHLFTFHMIEHELVMAIAAPLIVVARPIGVLIWGLPRAARHLVMTVVKSHPVERTWDFLTKGTVATLLHGLAIWIWHAPALFDATVTVVTLHRLQHLSFFVTAILFWWAIVWKVGRGAGAWHLFVTMMHTSVLGALITLSPRVAYVSQTQAAPDWGLTPLEDQQLAGIVMWVPGGIIYAGAALAMLAIWISTASRGGAYVRRL
ncbi:cytochrome c oxidase assembly protein [Rhizobium cauense]|uniref:cytochrome c oxidase assembly protein n=1 Tax=Rhizobium cauense TaxID=1166683 RepID=UPI001C6E35B3|nr:cytochrome c oxidase assembly protein [Rhizobium cauense]MBW9117687.1 cytochrome c oxidase assembly protein [Rhizobium cauense]